MEEGVSQRTNELKNFEMVEKEALKQAKVIEKDMKNAEKSQKSLVICFLSDLSSVLTVNV